MEELWRELAISSETKFSYLEAESMGSHWRLYGDRNERRNASNYWSKLKCFYDFIQRHQRSYGGTTLCVRKLSTMIKNEKKSCTMDAGSNISQQKRRTILAIDDLLLCKLLAILYWFR